MNIIELKKLDFSYDNKKIFNNLDFELSENSFNFLSGKNLSGKTTFLKLISGLYYTSNIKYYDTNITEENSHLLKDNSKYINLVNIFYSKTVFDELDILTESNNGNYIKKILKDFNLYSCIHKSPLNLTTTQKCKLSIIKAIMLKTKILLIDNIFTKFNKEDTINTIEKLRDYSKKYNITVIIASMDSDLVFYFEKIIILDNKKVIFNDSYLDEDLYRNNNLQIPFVCELSDKLKLYNLINNDIYDFDGLVNEIC